MRYFSLDSRVLYSADWPDNIKNVSVLLGSQQFLSLTRAFQFNGSYLINRLMRDLSFDLTFSPRKQLPDTLPWMLQM
jgi:hypothetical protein